MRRFQLLVVVAVAASLLTVSGTASARGSFRCGNRLIGDGDSIDQVFKRCGAPSFRDFSSEFVSFETSPGIFVTKEIPIETWTYNRGPREFVRYLKFRNGRLVRVDQGDYGY